MIRLPDDTNRLAIVGATGSGKTQAALWHLSMRDLSARPWVVYNFKGDEHIDSIPFAQHVGLDVVPKKPGIYITHPLPEDLNGVSSHMRAIWHMRNIGVYVDEGFMLGRNNNSYRGLLTQGRTRGIPAITLSQRPVWLDPFILSEAEYYQIFRLNHIKDVKSVEGFIPGDIRQRLPDYNSYYYDVGIDKLDKVSPVPDMKKIHANFARQLEGLRRTA